MKCKFCGQEINDGSLVCFYCGGNQTQPQVQPQSEVQPVTPPQQPTYQQPVQPNYQQPTYPNYQQPIQPNYRQPVQPNYQQPQYPGYQQPVYGQPTPPMSDMSWKDFYNRFVSKKSNSYVTALAIIHFITAALALVLMVTGIGDLIGVLDVAVYVAFGALLLTTKHWVCALLPTIYSGFWTVMSFASGGTPSGIVALVIGVSCVTVLLKADKAYKNYRDNHIFPTQQI